MNELIMKIKNNNESYISEYPDDSHLAFFDNRSHDVRVISTRDLRDNNFECIHTIKKASDLAMFKGLYFAGFDSFFSAYPESQIIKYINSEHTHAYYSAAAVYVAAYVYLYRIYKSFDVLVANDHTKLVDSFIESVIEENTEHPNTMAYLSKAEPHEALRLKKYVYTMFKDYLYDYEFYAYLLELQNSYSYKNKDFRKLKNKIKKTLHFDYEKPSKNDESKNGLKLIA